jgi:hypothetical protein
LRLTGYTNNELTREQRAEAIAVIATRAAEGTLTVPYETVSSGDAPAAWARNAGGKADLRSVIVS